MRRPIPRRRADVETALPHDRDREGRQPYAKEVEDYKHGVVTPPEEEGGQGVSPAAERDKK